MLTPLGQYTDAELERMTLSGLASLTEDKAITSRLISGRLRQGWPRRRAASEPVKAGRVPGKNHPFKKFTTYFYSSKGKAKLASQERFNEKKGL